MILTGAQFHTVVRINCLPGIRREVGFQTQVGRMFLKYWANIHIPVSLFVNFQDQVTPPLNQSLLSFFPCLRLIDQDGA